MDSKIHAFEKSGLGKAPFAYVGFFQGKAHADEFTGSQGCTACAYCSTGITNCFQIESSDGKKFIVGSECVKKTGDKGLIDLAKRELNRLKAIELDKKWGELKVKILNHDKEVVEKLDSQQHPWKPELTMFDYADYLVQHGAYDTSKKRIFKALNTK
jgi:ferredoxin